MTEVLQVREGVGGKGWKATAKVEEIVGEGFSVAKFEENFEVLVEAGGGVAALRRLVLDLALRGRVTSPQQAVAGGGVFPIPSHWAWGSGDDVFSFVTSGSRGWAQYYSESGPLFLRIGNLDYESTDLDLRSIQRVRPPANAEGLRTRVEAGDVLISITGDTGMVGLVPPGLGEAYINQHIALARPGPRVHPAFVARALTAPSLLGRLQGAQRGIKNSLGLDDVRTLAIPLPPLAEQKRIVAKVDQVMALCDELEARQTKKRETGARLTKSALEALTTAEGPEEFEVAWRRVVENFDTLVDRAEKVGGVRRAVLELATRGVLVPQAEAEGTGRAQLSRITLERNAAKPGSTGPDTAAPAAPPLAHQVPHSWCWASLEVLTHPVRVIRYGMLMPGPDRREGPRYVKVRNMKNGVIDVSSLPRTTPEIYAKFAQAALARGDLLMSIRGSYGGVALVPDEIEGANITQDSARIAPLGGVERSYLLLVLRSPLCQRFFLSVAKGAAVQGINIGDIRRTPVPLPPLGEQRRIVAKVEHLMKVCDALEAHLRRSEDRASKLVEAVVQEMVA